MASYPGSQFAFDVQWGFLMRFHVIAGTVSLARHAEAWVRRWMRFDSDVSAWLRVKLVRLTSILTLA